MVGTRFENVSGVLVWDSITFCNELVKIDRSEVVVDFGLRDLRLDIRNRNGINDLGSGFRQRLDRRLDGLVDGRRIRTLTEEITKDPDPLGFQAVSVQIVHV